MSVIASLLKIESLLRCELCDGLLKNTRTLNECGHRFCHDCVFSHIGSMRQCPTCKLPAIVKNLRKDPMHDTLVTCVTKLKVKLAESGATESTTNSLSLPSVTSDNNSRRHSLTQGSAPFNASLRATFQLPQSGLFFLPESLHTQHSEQAAAPLSVGEQVDISRKRSREYGSPIDALSAESIYEADSDDDLIVSPHISPKRHRAEASTPLPSPNHSPHANQYIPDTPSVDVTAHQPTPSPTTTSSTPNQQQKPTTDAPGPSAVAPPASVPQSLHTQFLLDDMLHNDIVSDNEDASAVDPGSIPQEKHDSSTPVPDIRNEQSTSVLPVTEQPESAENGKTLWACLRCFYVNKPSSTDCVICREPKGTRSDFRFDQIEATMAVVPWDSSNALVESTMMMPSYTSDTGQSSHSKSEYTSVGLLFTGLDAKEEENICNHSIPEAIQANLTLTAHSSIRDFDKVTHIVTVLDDKKHCRRTVKYLFGILAGKWIVDQSWLFDSIQKKYWVDEGPYEAKGDRISGTTDAPSQGRKRWKRQESQLFEGVKFYFYGDFQDPYNRSELLQLCLAAGGQILSRKPKQASRGAMMDGISVDHPSIDISQPVIIIPHPIDLNTKKTERWLRQYQVRQIGWMIDRISQWTLETC